MKILNFGSLNIDKVYHVPHFVRPGETIASRDYQIFPGGKGLNQTIAAARAGLSICHAGTIGPDGRFLKELLEESGADTRFVREKDTITGNALIQVSGDGDNCIILFGGSNRENDRDYIDQVLEEFGEGDILLLQNEISSLDYLLQRGGEKGMRILLNPSPMDEALKQTDLSAVTWLMLNETEGLGFTGYMEPERITAALLARYPRMRVVLTLGGDGALYADADRVCRQPCFPVKAVDTTAAGDTFTGYFLAAAVEGMEPAGALRLAAAAASVAVSRSGAAVSIPVRAEVEKLLQNGAFTK